MSSYVWSTKNRAWHAESPPWTLTHNLDNTTGITRLERVFPAAPCHPLSSQCHSVLALQPDLTVCKYPCGEDIFKPFHSKLIALLSLLELVKNWACILFYDFYFYFLLLRASSEAYGASQARGWIGDAASGLRHSNTRSELCLQLTPQLTATPDP